jgi:hypothetical protein
MNAQFHPQDFLISVKTTLKQLTYLIITIILSTHIPATQCSINIVVPQSDGFVHQMFY